MEVDEIWVTNILVDYYAQNSDGVSKIIKIQSESGVGKNENAGSDIIRLIVTIEYNSGITESKSFIYKRLPKGSSQEFLIEMDVFKTEILMYSKCLKEMKELKQKFQQDGITSWPECYGYEPDVLLLQDLKALGYVTSKRRSEGMNWNHASLVVKQLAEFHALSAVLLQNGTIHDTDFGVSIFHKNCELLTKLNQQGFSSLADSILANNWGTKWLATAAKLKEISQDIGSRIKQIGEKSKGKWFDVLNHGDCWTNNFMFKYEEDESTCPTDMMILDFQVCHVNSFAWDLTYFFYNCLLPDFRRESIDKLLDLYHTQLYQLGEFYQFNGQIPSREEVQKAMDEVQLFGLLNSVCTIPLLISVDKADFEFDLDKLRNSEEENNEQDSNPYQSFIYNDQTLIDIMKRDLEYFTSIGLL